MHHRQVWALLAKAAYDGAQNPEYTANLKGVLLSAHRILDQLLQDNTMCATKELMLPKAFHKSTRASLNTMLQMSGFELQGTHNDVVTFRANHQAVLSSTGSACLHQMCYTLLDVAGRLECGFELDAKLDKISFYAEDTLISQTHSSSNSWSLAEIKPKAITTEADRLKQAALGSPVSLLTLPLSKSPSFCSFMLLHLNARFSKSTNLGPN